MSAGFSSLFISHGAPTLPISNLPARSFLAGLGQRLRKPDAVIVVSPHWMTRGLAVKSPPRFETWHDFYGFPEELNRLRYEAPGDVALRDRTVELLKTAGLDPAVSPDRKLDHGAWVPLLLMFPTADVPVVQVSATWDTPKRYYELGRALRPLAQDKVLIVGSGGLVHNLREIEFDSDAVPDWARSFDDWTDARLREGDWATLWDYRTRGPDAARAHPTEDHFLPLFFAGGAGGSAEPLHRSFAHGGLSMAAYGFR